MTTSITTPCLLNWTDTANADPSMSFVDGQSSLALPRNRGVQNVAITYSERSNHGVQNVAITYSECSNHGVQNVVITWSERSVKTTEAKCNVLKVGVPIHT